MQNSEARALTEHPIHKAVRRFTFRQPRGRLTMGARSSEGVWGGECGGEGGGGGGRDEERRDELWEVHTAARVAQASLSSHVRLCCCQRIL